MPARLPPRNPRPDHARLDRVVAEARRAREARDHGYRERALLVHPWVCARCGRSFTEATVHELTVHHRDHDHDNNPPDGANWELLCRPCHDGEHSRAADAARIAAAPEADRAPPATHQPFANLKALIDRGRK